MAKKKELQTVPEIINPLVKVEGEDHVLQTLFDASELPEIKAVGYMRVSPESKDWISYTITTRGYEVINIDVSEPNLRSIAEDEAKVAFVTTFTDQE